MEQAKTIRVGLIGFDQINALDLTGPAEVFASVHAPGTDRRGYELVVLSVGARGFRAESGLSFTADRRLHDAPPLDTLVIPGGQGLREPRVNRTVAAWIAHHAAGIRRIASVCTGIYGLAPTGLLDGRRVTTHWRFVADIARRFPTLQVEPDALFVREGKYYTAAGISAGMDLALALVEEDFGPTVALAAARELVVYVKRPGGQSQFSEPLQFQLESTNRYADLAAWIDAHLKSELSIERLAGRVALCPRHFARTFKQAMGLTPAAFVEQRRLGEAGRRLVDSTASVEQIARSVGFAYPETFRRAFERTYKVNPSQYRSRFRSS